MATVCRLWRGPTLFVMTLSIGAIMLGFTGEIPVPLRPGNTWTLVEVGGSRGLINGLLPQSEGTTIEIVLRAAGLLAFALALMSLTRSESHSPPACRTAYTSRPVFLRLLDAVNTISMTPRIPLVIYLIAYLLLANVLWMYNDRYLIVLLPIVVALALGGRQHGAEVPRLAWIAMAIFATVAVVGTWDALRFNQSVRDSWQALAHPENLGKGLTVQDVPWITSKRRPTYILSKSALAGYDVAREVAWTDDAPWPGPNRLLVLKRQVP